ncbi:MAG: MTH938/NDUFAF3 family protein [Neisseria sp.]|nr:MTH938/NDUFAF3 family protein [Neisseria sp.]
MNFEEHTPHNIAYQTGELRFQEQSYTTPQIITDSGCRPISESTPQQLTAASFQNIIAATASTGSGQDGNAPEIIIVGTGEKQVFIHPKIVAELAADGIALESMNSAAACRTYLILQSEGRRVWLWLWV